MCTRASRLADQIYVQEFEAGLTWLAVVHRGDGGLRIVGGG